MMNIHFSTYLGFIFLSVFTFISQAATPILPMQDSQLQACLLRLANENNWNHSQDVTDIKCHSESIQSLRGLEQFTDLASLSLYNNRIATIDIDLKSLKNLQQLNLARNNLTTLEITSLPKLKKLYAFDNHLTDLTLSQLAELTEFKTNNNKIIRFSYQNTPKIEKIYIFNNQLETIDIFNLPSLKYMDCRQNPMPDSLYDEMDKQNEVIFLHDGNAEDW